jgi:hypothetical protein
MTYLDDVEQAMSSPDREHARQALYKLLRQGLTNAAAIPDVETEAEQAAHHMLGCDNYLALVNVYALIEDVRKDEPAAAAVISTMADEHLMLLVQAVLLARGPIGEHKCIGRRAMT